MTLKFGQIRLPVSIATDRVITENCVATFSQLFFYLILFILASYNDMLENLEEFEIWPDLTTDCEVSCLLGSEKIPIDL